MERLQEHACIQAWGESQSGPPAVHAAPGPDTAVQGPHIEVEVAEGGPAGHPEGGHKGKQDQDDVANHVVLVVEGVVEEAGHVGLRAGVQDEGAGLLAQIGADQAVQGPGDCGAAELRV